jgi:cell division protein FtsA
VTALDVGTTKVVCFVARADADGALRVIGIGHQASRGMRAGAVIDMEAVEDSIRAAVDSAERMAGESVREVHASIASGRPKSHFIGVEVAVDGHEIGDADLRRVLEQGRPREQPEGRSILHTLPAGFTIDGINGVRDPRGMFGAQLGVNIHVVTVGSGPLQNLTLCVERGDLSVAEMAVAPYAAGLSTLVEDEMRLGVTVVDMGGGTTTMGVFKDGELVHADSVALGGLHVTNDIAQGLATPTAYAERIKTLFGSAVASPADERELIDVPQVGEDAEAGANQIPRSLLVSIIQPRIEEILELVRGRLEAAGANKVAGRRVVLTGGASQLQGLRQLAARVLDKQVRMGRPLRIDGLAEATGGPAFAACAGLLRLATRERLPAIADLAAIQAGGGGPVARVGRWLKAHF